MVRDDEEDDRHSLVHQNDAKPTSSPPRRSHSAFHVEDFPSHEPPIRRFNRRRYLVAAVVVPLLILVLYFFTGIRGKFPVGSSDYRMREAELKALYLLNEQKLELLAMWNRTAAKVSSLSSLNSSVSKQGDRLLDDFQSAVLKQISLNKEIQDVLLLPHQSGNSSLETGGGGDFEDQSLSGHGLDLCKKVDQKLAERKTIEWKPRSDKFLFAICVSGQMSNHLICLEKHMFFAALLDRVLVIPSSKIDYEFNRVLDIDHINKCFGRKVVVTFEEFSTVKKNNLRIDQFICYFSLPDHCYVDDDHVKKLKGLGVSMGKLESPWIEDVKKPSKKTMQDVQAKFSSDDDVIAIGDVFFADVEQELVMQPGGPLAHKCKTLIEPSRLIMLTAQRFVQTFLGKNFAAIHFRRHGFLKFCNAKKPSCFYPIPQAADCVSRLVEKANTPVIYLSTDAAGSETSLLQSLIVVNGRVVPLVSRPVSDSAEKWNALLYRNNLDGDPQVEAMLDKTICAMSSVFIGTSGSTFTEDILRLRKDWGSASICDEYLCQGEEPNFIAENEE